MAGLKADTLTSCKDDASEFACQDIKFHIINVKLRVTFGVQAFNFMVIYYFRKKKI